MTTKMYKGVEYETFPKKGCIGCAFDRRSTGYSGPDTAGCEAVGGVGTNCRPDGVSSQWRPVGANLVHTENLGATFAIPSALEQEAANVAARASLQAATAADLTVYDAIAAEHGVKPTNPKDRIGSSKLPVSLVPDTVSILASMSFAEGASKYGAYNWRVAGVRLSIYMEAMRRHQMKLWNGEWADKKTKVPHLASIIACCGIIEDARLCGKLTDDRPPVLDIEPYIEEAEAIIRHVMQMNAGLSPHHCTINDPVVA